MFRSIFSAASITLFLLLSIGCSLFTDTTAVLWTDRPEIAAYVEVFNSEQDVYKIEVQYKDNPGLEFSRTEPPPDILFGEGLASASSIERFSPLDKMYKEETLDPEVFYNRLLRYGIREEKQLLLPVSFKLPVIIFKKGIDTGGSDNIILTAEEMKEICSAVQLEDESENPHRLCFAVHWEPSFLYNYVLYTGTDFRETAGGELAWNERQLRLALREMSGWSEEINGGLERELLFTEKHLYNPGYKLVDTENILFYYMELQKYFDIPGEKRDNLDFRWFGKERKIILSDDILFAGVPQKAKNKKAARAFLSWYFTEDTQRKLLQNSRLKRIRSFGIAGGFSSLYRINERDIPAMYPDMIGMIPPAEYLEIPPPLPLLWPQIKEEVILPWLKERVVQKTAKNLDERLREWYLQRPSR